MYIEPQIYTVHIKNMLPFILISYYKLIETEK